MKELVWINGEVQNLSEARIGVEDRGFQFADGVYEVVKLYKGRPFTLDEHLERMEKSAAGIALAFPVMRDALAAEIMRLVAQAGVGEGMVYVQLTRGAAPRNHLFPASASSTLLFYARGLDPIPDPGAAPGVRLISVVDERWKRCWIKSIALLPNVLAKNQAVSAGADEAVFVDEGIVNECSVSNFYCIIGGKLVTHPVGPKVLPGITRAVVLQTARAIGVPVEERPMLESEAKSADEIFITSTTRELGWVSHWDGQKVRASACGPVTLKLHQAFRQRVLEETRAS